MPLDGLVVPVDGDAPLDGPLDSIEEKYDPEAEALAELLKDYWAAAPGDKLYTTLLAKEKEFFEVLEGSGILQICRLTYAQMYGLDRDGGSFETQQISFAGEDGELVQFRINEFSSYANQIVAMATKNRPSFQCQAINDDAQSLNQIESSDAITTYFYEQVYGERKERATVEADVHFGKAWTLIDWDPDGGREIEDPETGGPVMSGEMVMRRLFFWDVVHETHRSEYDGHLWRMTRERKSRWEMMARYPKFAAKIKECPGYSLQDDYLVPGLTRFRADNEDEVIVRTFYHAKSAALKGGRKCVFVGETLVNGEAEPGAEFANGVELPVDEIPLVDLMSQEIIGTSFGYASSWDWLPINQMLDQITSDISTNVESFGRPTIMMTETADVDLDSLADGKRVLWLPPGLETPPTALQIEAVPELSLKLAEYLHNRLQSLSGLNSVARGNPDNNINSGEMAALFNAIAIEFQGARQAALDTHRERVANIQLLFLKKYAAYPQMIAIAGEDERDYLQEFTQNDLAGVHRVVVKTAAPMLRSQSGRMQIAQFLMNIPGAVPNPQQIIELVVSGRWKPAYKVTRQGMLRINDENQKLRKGPEVNEQAAEPDPLTGQPPVGQDGMPLVEKSVPEVPVMMFDDHVAHLIEHAAVLYAPSASKDPAIIAAVYAHCEDHMRVWRSGDPDLARALGHAPPPQLQLPMDPAAEKTPNPQSTKQAAKPFEQPTDQEGPRLPTPAKPAEMPQVQGMA